MATVGESYRRKIKSNRMCRIVEHRGSAAKNNKVCRFGAIMRATPARARDGWRC